MAEISTHRPQRLEAMKQLFYNILHQKEAVRAIRTNKNHIENTQASDIIALVHQLTQEGIDIPVLKTTINKFLNVLGHTIRQLPEVPPEAGSLTTALGAISHLLVDQLNDLKPVIKALNRHPQDEAHRKEALSKLRALEPMLVYYSVKENVLFPVIERHWPNFGCLQVMWSFHDDIRQNLRQVREMLEGNMFDLARFNRLTGVLYFTMFAIHMRDTKILLPYVAETIPEAELNALIPEIQLLGLQLPGIKHEAVQISQNLMSDQLMISLPTGELNPSQLLLIFNHLPVDITLVDEHNKVRFYSDPSHRIFPRSKAIIGRDVRQCHPPESLETVVAIIDAFRQGRQKAASFWIDMKGRKIMIRYYALSNDSGQYKGVLEVSQDITEMVGLTGERRLLQWDS